MGLTKTCLMAMLTLLAAGSAWGASVINCALTSPTPGSSPASCVDFSNVTGPGYNNSFSWLNVTGTIMISSTNPFDPAAAGTMTGGVPITVLPPAQSPSELEVMGNTKYVYVAGQWVPALILNDAVFPGHFGFNPTSPSTGYSGDALLTAPNEEGPVTIDFGQGVSAVAFEISSLSAPTFIATLNAYDQAGNLLGTYTLDTTNLTGANAVGGPCSSLTLATGTSPGSGCASTPAPFVGLSEQSMQLIGVNQIYSIQISTNDPRGFALDELFAQEEPPISTPEPTAASLAFLGLSLVFLRWRNFREPHQQL